jgi:thioredoxin 1
MGKRLDNSDYLIEVTDENIDDAIARYPFLVIYCWAEWCLPCKTVDPIIARLAKDHKGDIVFGKLDMDSNQDTESKYNIRAIPNLLVFKNEKKVGDITGAMPEEMLLERINTFR